MVEDGTLPRSKLTRDALGYLIAGTDTTSNTLEYLIFELAKHPAIQADLVEEVATPPAGYTDRELRDLKLLNGVINEALRLHPSIPAALPRLVPPEGANFCEYFVPGGTTVGIQASTMGRAAAIWPNPDRFESSRWLSPTKEQKLSFLPFGGR